MQIIINFIDRSGDEQELVFEITNPQECGMALFGISAITQEDAEFHLTEPVDPNLN